MEITFKGRQTDIPVKFREHATAKLTKLEKLDQKAMRIDVEVAVERNPRLASQKERVELTVRSKGPAIRAEAAAEDRFAALDLALAKLDSRLRRALERRKNHHGTKASERSAARREAASGVRPGSMAGDLGAAEVPAPREPGRPGGPPLADRGSPAVGSAGSRGNGRGELPGSRRAAAAVPGARMADGSEQGYPENGEAPDSRLSVTSDSVVPIDMEGDGPLVVRQKFHHAEPITIDQALLEMELVGHDFYLFHDVDNDLPSVVYRRRGYQYGVIRLVDNPARQHPESSADRSGVSRSARESDYASR